jgi:hypothetical protein
METIEERRSNRVHFSLLPAVFDAVRVIYSDDVTEAYVYTLKDGKGDDVIVGIIEIIYTSSTKDRLLSARRVPL